MTVLLARPPYGPRDEVALLAELVELTRHHLSGCAQLRRIWPDWEGADRLADLPWLHVGLFKHLDLRTPFPGARFERTLMSSSTTGAQPSRIVLDQASSQAQGESSAAILRDFLGERERALLVLDSARSLRARGEVSARIAAALSLRPLAREIHFLLADPADPATLRWDLLEDLLGRFDGLLVYGFTWMLWLAWGNAKMPQGVRDRLRGRRIDFVHSGGWKRLDALRVDRERFDRALLDGLDPQSRVTDFYGLVEQVGIVYPLCPWGFRHVPVWAAVLVRDPLTLEPLEGQPGQIQLLNPLSRGVPCHNVLTEDLGIIHPGPCPCGRSGPRFELLGRLPKAEIRGCANA